MDSDRRIHVKVVLLGRTHSGKSCLVKRYMEGNFEGDQLASVGCAFAARSLIVGNVELCLGIWDTCGQERFEALTRIYYQNASAAIVCHDLLDQDSFEKTAFWINELKEYNNESAQVYLVGTKCDLVEDGTRQRAVEASKVEAFAKEVGAVSMETSSKTGRNINELFQSIAKDFVQMGLHRKKRVRSIKLHEKPPGENEEHGEDSPKKSGWCCGGGGKKTIET